MAEYPRRTVKFSKTNLEYLAYTPEDSPGSLTLQGVYPVPYDTPFIPSSYGYQPDTKRPPPRRLRRHRRHQHRRVHRPTPINVPQASFPLQSLAPYPFYVVPVQQQIHPSLDSSFFNSLRIKFDLFNYPSSDNGTYPPFSTLPYISGATKPVAYALTIQLKQPPWEIHIASHRWPGYVTVHDVLSQLHEAVWKDVTPTDLSSLSYCAKRKAKAAYRRRGGQGTMKIIDLFMGKSRFMGLSRTRRPNVWRLETGR